MTHKDHKEGIEKILDRVSRIYCEPDAITYATEEEQIHRDIESLLSHQITTIRNLIKDSRDKCYNSFLDWPTTEVWEKGYEEACDGILAKLASLGDKE